jgi:hypothetical protein
MNQEFKRNFCSTTKSLSETHESRIQMAVLQHNKPVFRYLGEEPVLIVFRNFRPAVKHIQLYSKVIGCHLLGCVAVGV